MELTWLGTAGFIIRGNGRTILIDPYLSRNPQATPRQPWGPGDLGLADAILISHGHFDHLRDVPRVAAASAAHIYCDPVAAATLIKQGVPPGRISTVTADGQSFDLGGMRLTANFSQHVRFDFPLIMRTLPRILSSLGRLRRLTKRYPCGQVLAWRIQCEGRSILHLGSAGATGAQLAALAGSPTDLLLLPLQGHSRISDIAVGYVEALHPAMVMPQHHDDFYPPVSQQIDVEPFVEQVAGHWPEIKVIVPRINQPVRPWDPA